MGRTNRKNAKKNHIFLGGPMGPIQPLWASLYDLLLSTLAPYLAPLR